MLAAILGDNLEILSEVAQFNGGNFASNFRDKKGQNMLMIAVNSASHQCLAYLLQNGANININEVDYAGNTALMHAAKNGDVVSTCLLLNFSADRSLQNKVGFTAYDLAADGSSEIASGYAQCIKLLISGEQQDVSENKSEEFFSHQDIVSSELFGWLDDSRVITTIPVSAEDFPGADKQILGTFFDLS